MTLVDVHAHLDMFEDLPVVMERSQHVRIIANGVHPQSNRAVLDIARRYNNVLPALGFYPTHVKEFSDADFEKECAFIRNAKPSALGEVGLDYKEIDDEQLKERMRAWFIALIQLSKELRIPLIVHSRKAELDVIELLEQYHAEKVIMHCFSGRKHLVERVRKNGWYFSIPCIVGHLQQFQDIVKETPIMQLLTETDAPYLAPVRGEKNEPCNVNISVKKIAELKGMTVEETEKNIFMNYQRLFL